MDKGIEMKQLNNHTSGQMSMDTKAIQDFLLRHRSKDRIEISYNQFNELRDIFFKKIQISLNPSPSNPLSTMEMITVALSFSLKIREIADVTMNSTSTIKTNLNRIYQKLNVTKKRNAVLEAIKKGYIEVHQSA